MEHPRFRRILPVAMLSLAAIVTTHARPLTFQERVDAQDAIERVYYFHQSGAHRSFEEVLPNKMLERRVEDYLRKSEALEQRWATPITAAMLRAEWERIASATKVPARLREVEAALGDDPVRIQECLVRPILVDRLLRSFYRSDERLHADERQRAVELRERLLLGHLGSGGKPGPVSATDRGYEIRVDPGSSGGPAAVFRVSTRPFQEWWAAARSEFDGTRVAAVADDVSLRRRVAESESESATACGPEPGWNNGILNDVPGGRSDATAVWTGTHVIFWGGGSNEPLDSGGLYDPLTDTWKPMSRVGAPVPRFGHVAVWTGQEMLVWGGEDQASSGGRYDPLTDQWAPMSSVGAPAVFGGRAIWTGTEMLVWGWYYVPLGRDLHGGRYDPATDSWTPISEVDKPTHGPIGFSAVWTGWEMIVFGGGVDAGGRYNPEMDTWGGVRTHNGPGPRQGHAAVWTGERMIVFGASSDPGVSYDPVRNQWRSIASEGAPPGLPDLHAAWTGDEMIVWHGTESGGRYRPDTDTWASLATANAPGYTGSAAAWAGDRMVVWGGPETNTGGRYDPVVDAWTPTATATGPSARLAHHAHWTGSRLLIWGGVDTFRSYNMFDPPLRDGARYDPITDSWSEMTLVGAPAGDGATAWTGDVMVEWGGWDGEQFLATGARYDPAADTWEEISTAGAPVVGRDRLTAVWTGSEVLFWGGTSASVFGGDAYYQTGGRYDPTTDSWSYLSVSGAPTGRADHVAVWTGTEMLIWGGKDETGDPLPGGRYDPATNSWSPVSSVGAPPTRTRHTGVWTGSELLAWGGSPLGVGGGRYDPISDSWEAVSNDGPWRQWHGAVWTGSRMLIWGGQSADQAYEERVAEYDPDTDTWQESWIPGGPPGGREHSATWTGDAMVVWGGEGPTGYLDCGGWLQPEPGPPGEVEDLRLGSDAITLSWEDDLSTPGVTYDVVRGVLGQWPVGGGAAESCLFDDLAVSSLVDTDVPTPAGGFYYLVERINGCGGSGYGAGRTPTACP